MIAKLSVQYQIFDAIADLITAISLVIVVSFPYGGKFWGGLYFGFCFWFGLCFFVCLVVVVVVDWYFVCCL
jgi:hypothetical protein